MWTERFEEIGKLDYQQFKASLDQVMRRVAARGVCVAVFERESDKPKAIVLNYEDFLELIDDIEAISAMVDRMDLTGEKVSLDEILKELAQEEE